jgi:hypothetical protein
MNTILIAFRVEEFTGVESTLGVFPDNADGMEKAIAAAQEVRGPDGGIVVRFPFGRESEGEGEKVW